MNYEIAAQLTLVFSLLGMAIIVFRKMPILITLPELPPKESLISRFKKIIKEIYPFKNFSYELFLQKIIHQIRIFTLKADNKTFSWLKKLRERSHKKRIQENDHYWDEIRNKTK